MTSAGTQAWWIIGVLLCASCGQAVCPPNTTRGKGEYCVRMHADGGLGTEDSAETAAPTRAGSAPTARAGASGVAGRRANDSATSSSAGASGGEPDSAMTSGSGHARAGADAAQAGKGGSQSARGGEPADPAIPHGGAGTVAAGSGGRSSAAGDAGVPSETAGQSGASGPATGGMQGPVVAGNSAANGGTAGHVETQPGSRDWTCIDSGGSCTCVALEGEPQDLCTVPKPPCCFTIHLVDNESCQCWPEDSNECATFMMEDPNARRVPTCPPE